MGIHVLHWVCKWAVCRWMLFVELLWAGIIAAITIAIYLINAVIIWYRRGVGVVTVGEAHNGTLGVVAVVVLCNGVRLKMD